MNFQNLSDEALVALAQSDNQYSDEVFRRYDSAIKKLVRKYIYSGSDDLFQAGALGLYSAIKNYDGTSNFDSFAYTCINNSIRSELRKNNSKKNQPLIDYVPLTGYGDGDNDKTEILVDSSMGPEAQCLSNETKHEIEISIKESLSDLEYKILALFLQDYTYSEIGEKLLKSEKSVDNAVQRIRKKLRKKLEK